jgi:hypothetical protein
MTVRRMLTGAIVVVALAASIVLLTQALAATSLL